MKELTQEQVQRFSKEMLKFLKIYSKKNLLGWSAYYPSGKPVMKWQGLKTEDDLWKEVISVFKFHEDWSSLMTVYEKLCKVLPHNFCDIQKDKVYANGYIDLPLKLAIFYVVGRTCEEYNSSSK